MAKLIGETEPGELREAAGNRVDVPIDLEAGTVTFMIDNRANSDTHSPGEGSTLTVAGQVLGTLAYMPPEQARGETNTLDARADVFALGGILCIILTGKPPYAAGGGNALMRQAIDGNVADALTRLDACGADPELVSVCRRCLAPDQADRPADAGEVAKAIEEWREAAERRARQAEQERARAEVRATEQRKRRRVQTALALVIALLLVGGAAVAWWQERQASDRRAADMQRQFQDEQRKAEESARLSRNAEAAAGLLDQIDVATSKPRCGQSITAAGGGAKAV